MKHDSRSGARRPEEAASRYLAARKRKSQRRKLNRRVDSGGYMPAKCLGLEPPNPNGDA